MQIWCLINFNMQPVKEPKTSLWSTVFFFSGA